MMKIPLTTVMGLLLMASACNRGEPTQVGAASEEQSTTANTTANTEVQQREREDYVKAIRAKLNEFNKKFDGLEARTSTMTGTAKDDFDKMIQQLRDQEKSIVSQLDNAKNASPDGWRLMKADLDSQLAKLDRSYQELSNKIELTPATPPKNPQKSY